MVLDPDTIDAFARLGFGGAAIIAVFAFSRGSVRRGKETEEVRAADEARIAELRTIYEQRIAEEKERGNEWKKIAQGAIGRLEKITSAFEDLAGRDAPD